MRSNCANEENKPAPALTRLLLTALVLVLGAAHAAPPSPARQAYDEISQLRNIHSAVIHGGKAASPEELIAVLRSLDEGLRLLEQPLNQAMAQGDRPLRFRKFNLLIDKAKIAERLGRRDQALAALEAASRMAWLDLNALIPQGDPEIKAILDDPRSTTLRNRYAVSRRMGEQSPLNSPFSDALAEPERLAGLARVWSMARQYFVWFDHAPELDWDQAYLAAIPRVQAAKDTESYYRELMRFVAQLKDGHSNVYPPQQLASRFYSGPGVRTRRIEGRVLVVEIMDPALETLGLRVGDEIESIDAFPVERYAVERIQPWQSSSTAQDLEVRIYDYMLLAGDARQPVDLGMIGIDGRRYVVRAARSGYATKPGTPAVSFVLRPDGIAVLRAGQFETDAAAKLMEANIDAILRAKGLVLDLRGNGGGSSDLGWLLLSWLSAKPVPTPSSLVRDEDGNERARQGPSPPVTWTELPRADFHVPRQKLFDGPVALLIDARTFSAAEDTAAAFKLMRRGLIVGTASGGSTGQAITFALPGGGTARVCVKRDSYPDGSDFVGVGVQPDVVVAPTVANVRAGEDVVLERAIMALFK